MMGTALRVIVVGLGWLFLVSVPVGLLLGRLLRRRRLEMTWGATVGDERKRRWWDGLTDTELAAQLEQRGVGLVSSGALVHDRLGGRAGEIIDRVLSADR